MRRRRAWLTGWFLAASCLANFSLPFSGGVGVPPQPLAGPLVLAQAFLAVFVFWRGARITDWQFVAVQLVVVAIGVPLLLMSVARGSLRPGELVILVPLLLAAVFCTTRTQVVLVDLPCLLGGVLVIRHRIIDPSDVISESIGQVICFGLLAMTVRTLREWAHDALDAAKKGEITDPLTGLLNRRGFERLGGHAWGRRATDQQCVAVLVLDVDHFKRINDTFGHAAGDDLLRRLAEVLVANTRTTDLVVRLGGEEFAVLSQTEPGEGPMMAERLRVCVEHDLAPVTVSIGIVEATPEPVTAEPGAAAALWQAVALADTGLYEAKRTGRNRVVVSDTPVAL